MNLQMIEALYQNDLKRADDTRAALIEAAEKQRRERLAELDEQRRADYREEQRFFFQG